MVLALKPTRMNGQTVFRGVERGPDGVMHENSMIVFQPAIKVGRPPELHPQELVELALRDLITVSDQTGDPVIKAQAMTFRKKLKDHQTAWLARAASNEREAIRRQLKQLGFEAASEAI